MAEEKTTRIKKKKWCQIVGPSLFREAVLGETLVIEPQSMLDKTLKVNLMNLTRDVKQQNVNIKFQISEIRGDRAMSNVIGYEIIPATIRRLVRRGKKRLDMSFICETSDNVKVRVKPLLITKKTMKSSVNSAIRKSIIDYLSRNIKKINYNSLVSNLVSRRVQRSLRDHIRKIYPLRICEIKEMSIEKEVAPEEKLKELKVEKKKEEVKPEVKEVPKEEKKEEAKKEDKPKEEALKVEKKEEVKKEEQPKEAEKK